jgi:hypothetical protein
MSLGAFGVGSNSAVVLFRHEFRPFNSLSLQREVFICEGLPNLPFESRFLNRESIFV